MKPNIHPKYKEVKVTCSCGNAFVTSSTLEKDDLHLEVCSNCHPFYTGKQKLVDTAGRVDRFRKKYSDESLAQKQAAIAIKAPEVQAEPAKKTSKAKKPAAKTATKKVVKE